MGTGWGGGHEEKPGKSVPAKWGISAIRAEPGGQDCSSSTDLTERWGSHQGGKVMRTWLGTPATARQARCPDGTLRGQWHYVRSWTEGRRPEEPFEGPDSEEQMSQGWALRRPEGGLVGPGGGGGQEQWQRLWEGRVPCHLLSQISPQIKTSCCAGSCVSRAGTGLRRNPGQGSGLTEPFFGMCGTMARRVDGGSAPARPWLSHLSGSLALGLVCRYRHRLHQNQRGVRGGPSAVIFGVEDESPSQSRPHAQLGQKGHQGDSWERRKASGGSPRSSGRV